MTLEANSKVQARHLKRHAYLYVRQSSLRQVLEHTESTQRQYNLKQRAIALGWAHDQIVVVDNDQGLSGASAVDRAGFQTLVADVGLAGRGLSWASRSRASRATRRIGIDSSRSVR